MGIIQGIKGLVTKAASSVSNSFIKLTSSDSRLFTLFGNDYKFGQESIQFLTEAYGQNPYVFMVVDRIVNRMVSIDKILLNSSGEQTEDEDFIDLLESPNTKENGKSFLYRAGATYLSAGECFVLKIQEAGEQDQFVVPTNYNVVINENTFGEVLSYRITLFGESKNYLPNEVLHIKRPDITLDTNYGFSNLRATRLVWESNNEVWNSEVTLHKNKGIAGVLYSDGNRTMLPKEQQALQDEYDDEYTGVTKFGKVKVSRSKVSYVQMGMNPTDLKSIETRIEHLRTICASYSVDSKLFGDYAASTYNNMEEAKLAMITDAVIPLSKQLLPDIIGFMSASQLKSYSMKLDEKDIPEYIVAHNKKSEKLGREIKDGIITVEEARGMLYPEL